MTGKSYRIELCVGDTSGDGHGRTGSYWVKSSRPSNEVSAAYTAGVKIVGVDVSQAIQNGSKSSLQHSFTNAEMAKLKAAGIVIDCNDAYRSRPDRDEFVRIWCEIASIGRKGLKLKLIEEGPHSYIDLGGYGYYM